MLLRKSSVAALTLLALVVACGATTPATKPAPARLAPPPAAPATAASAASVPAAARVRPDLPDEAKICGAPVALRITAAATAKPFTRKDPECAEGNPFCDTADRAPDPKDACFVANANIARAEREARADRAPRPTTGGTRWDGTGPVAFLDRIDGHLHLTEPERAMLRKNGFVVLDRLPYQSYAAAFHDVFQEELPVYVGVDPILHAVAREAELVLEKVERARLVPALARMLGKLRGALAAARGRYPRETLEDLDVYLGVAWGLLEDVGVAVDARGGTVDPARLSVIGQDVSAHRAFLDSGREGAGLETVWLFGRERKMDFSQLTPRGHYAQSLFGADGSSRSLEPYFRAAMWLSRTELNLVSRDSASSSPDLSPAETPREVAAALALADLVERSGASAEVAAFEEVYGAFAGTREDVSMRDLTRLARERGLRPGDAEATTKLKAAIGEGWRRKARTHFTPEGVRDLPVIATLLGPRVVPDVAPLTRLVHDAVPERFALGGSDVGFLLGHDRGKEHLRSELTRFPSLDGALTRARGELATDAAGKTDVYGSWLRALLALGAPPPPTAPSYTRTPAYEDFRMSSALVGYGQLRHAYALLAAQGYDAYGCEIPDGFVEAVPAFWEALLAHVRNVGRLAPGSMRAKERVLGMLKDIAETEARGAPLSEAQRRWLGMVSENVPRAGYGGDSSAPPKWTGWYFDLFVDRHNGATLAPTFVADYMTLTNEGVVRYLGAEGPRLAVFVVDTGGGPRAMVGPVAKGYETTTRLSEPRLDDKAAVGLPPERRTAPWRSSFAAAPAEAPEIGLEALYASCETNDAKAPLEVRVALRADVPVGKVSVTLLDHHGDPLLAPATTEARDAFTTVAFELPPSFRGPGRGVSAWHVRVHDLAPSGKGKGAWDHATSPSVFGAAPLALMSGIELPARPGGLEPLGVGLVPPRPPAPAAPARRGRDSTNPSALPF